MKKYFFNAKIYSMDDDRIYSSMLIDNDKVLGLFEENKEISDCEKYNLNGMYILPGFIDTHTHSFEGGLYSLSADLSGAKSISDILEIISITKPIGGMLFAYHFDENNIKEKRFPSIEELDKVAKDFPLLLRRVDGHSCIVNSISIKKMGLNRKEINAGGGVLRKNINDFVAHYFHSKLTEEGIFASYKKAAKIGINNGLTTIHTMIGDANQNPLHYEWMSKNLNKFQIEYILYPQILNVETAKNLGSKRVGGCILADGSFGSHTAGLKKTYSDQKSNFGTLYQTSDFWINFVRKAHKNNIQVGVHAIGDAAIEQILTAYEMVQKENPKDLRHEIIHCELTSDSQIKRMAKSNVSAVMQPMFDRLWGGQDGYYQKVLGRERTRRTTRLKSIKSSGTLLTGGSDFYITELNPIKGIDAAEKIHNKKEALTRKEAIEIYTSEAAKLSHDENRIGSLKIGNQADFIISKNDPFKILNFLDLSIVFVYKNGIKVLDAY